MKTSVIAALAGLASNVAAHATFQALWVDGVDFNDQCARVPPSNSPVTNVNSNDIRCNAGTSPIAKKCPVKAGSTVTVEMHQVRTTTTHLPIYHRLTPSSNVTVVAKKKALAAPTTDP